MCELKGSPPPRAVDLLLEVLRTQSQVPLLRAQGFKERNKKYKKISFFQSSDVLDLLVPILHYLNDARADQARVGLMHIGENCDHDHDGRHDDNHEDHCIHHHEDYDNHELSRPGLANGTFAIGR